MMTTIALRRGLFKRVGTASRNQTPTLLRSASLFAPSTLCGSSMMTRSPRVPVIEPAAVACRQPPAVFSNFLRWFWSLVRMTRSPHMARYQSLVIRRRMRMLSRSARSMLWLTAMIRSHGMFLGPHSHAGQNTLTSIDFIMPGGMLASRRL